MSLAEQFAGIDLCAVAYGTNPNGSPPNFENPPSLQFTLIGVLAFLIFFAVIITSGRLYVNKHNFKLADYFIIIGIILDLALAGVLIALSHHFRHIWDTPICFFDVTYSKLTYVEVLFVGPSLFFPKAAIFLFYLQVFSVDKSVRIGSKIGLVLAFLAYVPLSLSLSYYDAPHVGQTWDDPAVREAALKGVPIGVAIGAASVFVDIFVFILPLPTLFSLNLSFKKRLQLIALFATAFTGVVASVICLVFRVQSLTDSGWQSGQLAIAVVTENNVAIIVGSLPAFSNFLRTYVSQRAFFKSLSPKLRFHSKSHANDPENKGSPEEQTLWTFGSPRKQKPEYDKLTDTAILKSNVSVLEDAIIKPLGTASGMGYSQQV
ncbi:hypothetical protein F4679DRAFT_60721 [Xylaria curta]|nr:hypothetical protein F4679DRAFT_60721 [Xylaria curta]